MASGEFQKKNDYLERILNERNDQLNRCAFELDNTYIKLDKLSEEKLQHQSELNKLKDQIRILTDQRDQQKDRDYIEINKLREQLANLTDQDHSVINRLKEHIRSLTEQNQRVIYINNNIYL